MVAFFFILLFNMRIETGEMDMSKLKLVNVGVQYHKVKAVQNFTLEIENKCFIVLAGPSGCGKTSLLHAIAGLVDVSQGSIFIEDNYINDIKPENRDIAIVFQEAALFPHLSVFDNIAFGLRYRGLTETLIQYAVHDVCLLLGIESLLRRRADTLSGGQKQRVSIARAIVRQPKLFLMDEPLSALDIRLKNQLRIEIAQLYKKQNATFLYVTHDQVEAMTLADILIIMKEGVIQQVGHPMDIYRHPKNLFTASFLGKLGMNMFEGHIREHTLYCIGRRLTLAGNTECEDFIIGVRSEHVYIDCKYGIEGEIVLIENAGDELYYHIQWERQIVMMKGNIRQRYKLGDSIAFSFHWRDALFFDKISEERVDVFNKTE